MKTTIEIDEEIWRGARARAIEEGRVTGRLLEDAIRLYLEKKKDWLGGRKIGIGNVIPKGARALPRKPKS